MRASWRPLARNVSRALTRLSSSPQSSARRWPGEGFACLWVTKARWVRVGRKAWCSTKCPHIVGRQSWRRVGKQQQSEDIESYGFKALLQPDHRLRSTVGDLEGSWKWNSSLMARSSTCRKHRSVKVQLYSADMDVFSSHHSCQDAARVSRSPGLIGSSHVWLTKSHLLRAPSAVNIMHVNFANSCQFKLKRNCTSIDPKHFQA